MKDTQDNNSTNSFASQKEAAIFYAETMLWRIIPLHTVVDGQCSCGNPNCPSRGKHPRIRDWQNQASYDIMQIAKWFEQWPNANIGVLTGVENRIVVLDDDPRNGGTESLDDLIEQHGPLPDTVEAITGGGGRHIFFKHPGGQIKCSTGKIGPGLDIKGDGGFVVVAPSMHVSGRQYEWELSSQPGKVALAEVPDWLLRKLVVANTPTPLPPPAPTGGSKIPEGSRNNTLTSLAGTMRKRGFSEKAIRAALLEENQARCVPPLADNEISTIAQSISRYDPDNNDVAPDKKIFHKESERPQIDSKAFYGLAGHIVNTIDKYIEGDPAAVLIGFLTAFGNCVGPTPHFQINQTKHHLRLFVNLVGRSAFGRKGTSFAIPKHILAEADPEWACDRISGGLSSGEGLIFEVRDPIKKVRSGSGTSGKTEEFVDDLGVADKRLLVVEEEYAAALKVMAREGNILSPTIRKAWDDGQLKTMTRNNPLRATGAHISIIGHITRDELLKLFTETEQANGFGNRFLWFVVERSKLIPDPVPVPPEILNSLISQVKECIQFARSTTLMTREVQANTHWIDLYSGPLNQELPGLMGMLTSRGPVQVMRLACIFALLDQSAEIRISHLDAAMAIWNYNVKSLRFIFGSALGDSYSDRILEELQACWPEGLTETAIWDVFGRHGGKRVPVAIRKLHKGGFICCTLTDTGGRRTKTWFFAKEAN